MMELLDLDIFQSSEEDPIFQTYDHPALAPQHLRRKGEKRFLFIVNFIIGSYQQVAVAAVNSPEESETWQHFLAQAPQARWRRLRVTAACFEGPAMVRDYMLPQKPSHLGKFYPSHTEGEGYLEVVIHLNSPEMRRLRVVFQHSYHIIINGLAYFLCDCPNEPSERLLFAHYCSRVDPHKLRQV